MYNTCEQEFVIGRVSNTQYALYKHTATSSPFEEINASPNMEGS